MRSESGGAKGRQRERDAKPGAVICLLGWSGVPVQHTFTAERNAWALLTATGEMKTAAVRCVRQQSASPRAHDLPTALPASNHHSDGESTYGARTGSRWGRGRAGRSRGGR
eukprot:CAMPEP_0196655724 /NCGR_PEP_ID=MMETSP1086-20130531/6815_1 /TAXON_ID=77921 /ORGANISM="Cyanoptyche  gloeocystis , Strain SAG4.97" /LENGTH=110 /DNA_ID=CAMNT_0041988185 /DNA_START=170 /DNA_END=499 /DNA_ORIENTATION=+